MNDQDFLIIQSLALSQLAEIHTDSQDPEKVRPLLMKITTSAAVSLVNSSKEEKIEFLKNVRASLKVIERAIEEKICSQSDPKPERRTNEDSEGRRWTIGRSKNQRNRL